MLCLGGGIAPARGVSGLFFVWLLVCVRDLVASDFGFRFVTWPSWQVVTPGKEVTLRCITNLPPDSIRWQHNHQYIGDDTSGEGEGHSAFRLSAHGSKGSSLVFRISPIPWENRQQEGLYQCVASVGSIAVTSLPGRIEIAYLKPFPKGKESENHLEIDEGKVFRVPCENPESLPEATLRFYKDGHLLDLADEKKYHVTQTGDLIILKATSSSEGWYSCGAYNSFLPETTEYYITTQVTVKKQDVSEQPSSGPPRLVAFDTVINAVEGDRIQLLCVAVDPVLMVLFTRKGSDTPIGEATRGPTVSMVIREASFSDEGIYRCHGNNSVGSSFVDITLFVQERPYVIKGPVSQSVPEEGAQSLECTFGGNPSPTVSWIFNGELLSNSRTVSLAGNRLELNPVRRNQAGIYQCFAFNPFGSAQDTAMITVIPKTVTASPLSPEVEETNSTIFKEREIDILLKSEEEEKAERRKKDKKKSNESKPHKKEKGKFKKPESKKEMMAPSRPNVTKLSDESVMVTWDVESNEGIPIVFFKVQYRVVGRTKSVMMDRRWKTIDEDILPYVKSFEVTGLETNQIYRFRVFAVYKNNDNQPGRPSKRFFLKKELKLQKPEKAPEILFLFPKDDQSLIVFWDYEAKTKTEGFIINYRESTSAVDYTKITLLGPQRRNHTVHYLKPNVAYDFKMCSFNMAGPSEFSERRTFRPKGLNLTSEKEKEEKEASTIVPIVRSEPEGGVSNRLLYITLGAGLGVLFLIVVASFTIYSCRTKDSAAEEDATSSRYMDASLRIHRLSTGDVRHPTQNGCQCHSSPETQVPLLPTQTTAVPPGGDQVFPTSPGSQGANATRKTNTRNGSMNVMRETSFTGSDQPTSIFRDSSLHSTFKRKHDEVR